MKKIFTILSLLYIIYSCDDIVEVENISDETVILLAPSENAILNITELTFSWQTMQDAEQYHLQIATPTFENALQILKDTTLTSTNFSTTLDYNHYQWRVKALNSGYQTGYTTQSFSIEE